MSAKLINGYESVPTLVFPDGSTLTEPTNGGLQAKLGEMGYTVPLLHQIKAWIPQLIFFANYRTFAVLRFLEVI